MASISVNDRLGRSGYSGVPTYSYDANNVIRGFLDPSGNIIKVHSILGESFSPITRTSLNSVVSSPADNAYVVLASIVVPANYMGLDNKLTLTIDWDLPNSASTKSLAVDFGGSNVSTLALTTGNVTVKGIIEIQNQHSQSSQSTFNSVNYGLGATNVRIATTIDTTQTANIDIKCKWGAAASSENIILRGYTIVIS